MTTHAELKKLVTMRLADANALFKARRYAGAYYMAGYAVECAIKAVLATEFKARDIPDKGRVQKIHTHNLEMLVRLADLEAKLKTDVADNLEFAANWKTVSDWSEVTRYNPSIRKIEARDILTAIEDPANGVLPWLLRRR